MSEQLGVDPRRLLALVRLLTEEGHMTPYARRKLEQLAGDETGTGARG